ncbi:MAG: DUF4349 domain-containing protein [Dehalococcoidia bacterium]|nr:DUF4349 domain-containing protein [Dehalococcoidia bacterium]
MASIDKALGRPTGADIDGSAAGASANSVAPMPPDLDAKPAQRESTANDASSGAAGASSGSAGASPVAPAQTAPGEDTSSTFDDRKIVQTASLRLQVKEVGGSFEEVGRIASSAGGFVASSNFSLQGENQIASVTIRVPADRYQDVLADLRRLGEKVDVEASNASDVTQEYTDLSARLRTLEATEAQLLTLLGQARNINEILQVQDRLNSVRGQIEQVKGRMALLDKLGDLATVTVHLRPVAAIATAPSGAPNLGAEVSEAWEASLNFLGDIAAGVIRVVVFAWWVPLLAIPTYAILRARSRTTPASAID